MLVNIKLLEQTINKEIIERAAAANMETVKEDGMTAIAEQITHAVCIVLSRYDVELEKAIDQKIAAVLSSSKNI